MVPEILRWIKNEPPDAEALRLQMENEGYTVTEFTDDAGMVYDSHSHADDQTHWIISGEAEFVVNGVTYQLGPGDRDFLPANTEHSAVVLGSEPVRYLTGVKLR